MCSSPSTPAQWEWHQQLHVSCPHHLASPGSTPAAATSPRYGLLGQFHLCPCHIMCFQAFTEVEPVILARCPAAARHLHLVCPQSEPAT